MSSRRKYNKIGRDAITGRFITVSEAVRRPRTSTVERIKLARRRRPTQDEVRAGSAGEHGQ
jgi:hypothetical protein